MSDRLSPSGERDPFVARALATLPVPEHAPDFWARLEVALDAVSSEARTEVPDQPHPAPLAVMLPQHEVDSVLPQHIDLSGIVRPGDERVVAPRRMPRGARPLLAAAAVVLTIAAVRLSIADDDSVRQAATPSGALAAGAGSSGAGSTSEAGGLADPTTTPVATDAQDAQDALLTFLDALGHGRHDEAAALIGPRSEAYLTEQSGSVRAFLTQASEGFGTWAFATDRVVTTVELNPGSIVVVLEGTLALEGTDEHRIDAFPMTKAESADAWFVDMWAFDLAAGGRLELSAEPTADGLREVRVGEPVEVFASAPGTVRFVLAGRSPVDIVTGKRGAANVATWTPSAADAGDARLLTVIFTSDDGTIFTALAVKARVD